MDAEVHRPFSRRHRYGIGSQSDAWRRRLSDADANGNSDADTGATDSDTDAGGNADAIDDAYAGSYCGADVCGRFFTRAIYHRHYYGC
jgi:hypothetical protein